jgi:hypothetical protein
MVAKPQDQIIKRIQINGPRTPGYLEASTMVAVPRLGSPYLVF